MSENEHDLAAYAALENGDAIIMDGPNLFADLELPDADDMLMRSQLVRRLMDTAEALGYDRKQLGRITGFAAAELTHLYKGRISRFSIERLVKAINAVDPDVRVEIVFSSPPPRGSATRSPA